MNDIKLLILDVDGVLTDGKIYITPNGEEQKSFNTQDGYGLVMLRKAGITIAIISGRSSLIVTERMAELGITHVYQGAHDKQYALDDLLEKTGIDKAHCAYVGDDLPDLPIMLQLGHKICVANATPKVLEASDWVTQRAGGEGAVREVCDWILDKHHVSIA
jgi:3-deoxy-D-manno-octulosonate 8-phosphate phosphatase (KDO 8-P phosphatase)